MKKNLDLKQLEEKLNVYYQNHPELEKPNFYCKDCGKFLVYDDADIHFNKRVNKNNKNEIIHTGQTFLSTREYNGHIYHLCRCKECVGKKYDTVYTRKAIYSCKFAQDIKYAYGISDEDFSQYTKARQAITKDSMIKKYGEEKGLEKWNSYCQKQAITNTFEYKKEKYGMSEKEFKEFNKSRACTKELFIKRYGEEVGIKKWDDYCERQRYTTSLDYFIKEYGIKNGIEKYNKFCDARIDAGKRTSDRTQSTSKIADEFFSEIIKYFPNNIIWTHITNLGEKIINHKFAIDYYDETLNIGIEFYGDYWHMNPIKYKEDDPIPYITKSKYFHFAKDIWKHDNIRISKISKKLKTNNIIIIWENDYRQNKKETIDKIVNIIKNQELKNNGN